jgi:hypothetical protein
MQDRTSAKMQALFCKYKSELVDRPPRREG